LNIKEVNLKNHMLKIKMNPKLFKIIFFFGDFKFEHEKSIQIFKTRLLIKFQKSEKFLLCVFIQIR